MPQVTLCLMTQYERVKGVHTSAVPFFFWLLASLSNVIPLYTIVMEQVGMPNFICDSVTLYGLVIWHEWVCVYIVLTNKL